MLAECLRTIPSYDPVAKPLSVTAGDVSLKSIKPHVEWL